MRALVVRISARPGTACAAGRPDRRPDSWPHRPSVAAGHRPPCRMAAETGCWPSPRHHRFCHLRRNRSVGGRGFDHRTHLRRLIGAYRATGTPAYAAMPSLLALMVGAILIVSRCVAGGVDRRHAFRASDHWFSRRHLRSHHVGQLPVILASPLPTAISSSACGRSSAALPQANIATTLIGVLVCDFVCN